MHIARLRVSNNWEAGRRGGTQTSRKARGGGKRERITHPYHTQIPLLTRILEQDQPMPEERRIRGLNYVWTTVLEKEIRPTEGVMTILWMLLKT